MHIFPGHHAHGATHGAAHYGAANHGANYAANQYGNQNYGAQSVSISDVIYVLTFVALIQL